MTWKSRATFSCGSPLLTIRKNVTRGTCDRSDFDWSNPSLATAAGYLRSSCMAFVGLVRKIRGDGARSVLRSANAETVVMRYELSTTNGASFVRCSQASRAVCLGWTIGVFSMASSGCCAQVPHGGIFRKLVDNTQRNQ